MSLAKGWASKDNKKKPHPDPMKTRYHRGEFEMERTLCSEQSEKEPLEIPGSRKLTKF